MKGTILLSIAAMFMLAGCASNNKPSKQVITVSIMPQKYFVERITGDKFDINVLLPPGMNPHTFEPSPKSMVDLSRSTVYFTIGHLEFEKAWMEKFKSVKKDIVIRDTSEGASLISREGHDGGHDQEHGDDHATDESSMHTSTGKEDHGHCGKHGPDGCGKHSDQDHGDDRNADNEDHHYHSGIDPHIWMSPKEVKNIARNIFEHVSAADAANKEFYNANYLSFVRDLEKLDMQINTMLSGLKNRKFIIYHPAMAYFARDYSLTEIPVEIDGKEPSPAQIKSVIDTARENGIKTVFIQKEFDPRLAGSIAEEIGGKVISIEDLSGDWLNNLITISRTLQSEGQE